MVRTKLVMSFALVAGFIVVAAHASVNKTGSKKGPAAWANGSSVPVPQANPSGAWIADGSPMPVPQPKPPSEPLAA